MSPPWHVQPTFVELANAKSPEFIHPNFEYKDATNSFALGRLLGNFQNIQASEEAELHATRVDSIFKEVSSVHGLPKDVLKALYLRAKDEGIIPPDAYDIPKKHRKVYRKGDLKDSSTQTERKTLFFGHTSGTGYTPQSGPPPRSTETQTIDVETVDTRSAQTQTYRPSVMSKGVGTDPEVPKANLSSASSSMVPNPAPPGAPTGTSGKDLLPGKTTAEMPAPSSAAASSTPSSSSKTLPTMSDLMKGFEGEAKSMKEALGPFMRQLVVKATAKEKVQQNAKKEEMSAGRLLMHVAQTNLDLAERKLNSSASKQFQRGLFKIGKDVFETAKKFVSPVNFGMMGARLIETGVQQRKEALTNSSSSSSKAVSAVMNAGREPVTVGQDAEEMLPEIMGRLQAAVRLPSAERATAMEALAKFLTDDETMRKSLTGETIQGLWNSLVHGHRVHGMNQSVLKERVNQEAESAWAHGDQLKYSLLHALFDLYTEEETPYSAPVEAAAASSSSGLVQDITQTQLYRQRLEEAARMVAQMQSSPQEPQGPPDVLRTPDGENPTINLETGEVRSVYVAPSTPSQYEHMYRTLYSNATIVARAASSSSGYKPMFSEYQPRYKGPHEDPSRFYQPRSDPATLHALRPFTQNHVEMEEGRPQKMQKIETVKDGHIVTTTKRIFVPSTHKDEDERYRNAQRAATQETAPEPQVLDKKKAFHKRRANFYGD